MGLEKLWRRGGPETEQPRSVEAEVADIDAENGVDEARRGLMKLLLGGAAAAALSESAVAGVLQPKTTRTETIRPPQSPEQAFRAAKQRILDESVLATRNAIASKDVQEALQWRGPYPISRVLRAIELPILPAHLDDTTYDVSELKRRYPVQIVRENIYNATNTGIISSELKIARAAEPPFRQKGLPPHEYIGYGNGFYFGDGTTLVTCEHVAKDFFPGSAGSPRHDSLDISVATVSNRFAATSADQIIQDDLSVTDADIEGALVCVVGRDPDPLSDNRGNKVYPGVAVKLTPEYAEGFNGILRPTAKPEERIVREYMKNVMGHSYMIVLPPGEGKEIFPETEVGKVPAQGMSGSPVFKNIHGKQRLVGIMWAVGALSDAKRNRGVDVAYFLPINAIRLVAKKTERWQLK